MRAAKSTILIDVIIFNIITKTMYCRLEPLPDELSSRLSLAQCIAVASDKFFEDGEIFLISMPLTEVSDSIKSAVLFNHLLFNELFHRSRLSIIIKETKNVDPNEKYVKYVDNYMIQVRNATVLEENLRVLKASGSWNPHATFMVVTVTLWGDNRKYASILIEILRKYKVVNGVILLPDPEDASIFEAYTWFPYSSRSCGNVYHELEMIDRCKFGKFETDTNWFPDKIPKDLNGCPVRVRTVVWPPFVLPPEEKVLGTKDQYVFKDGLEIRLMNTMAEMANFTLVYTVSDIVQNWGAIFYNGTATGSLLYLKNEQADVAISSFAVSVAADRYFDSIVYPFPEALNWCVPNAALIPKWKHILVVLSINAMIPLFIIYILTSYCIWKLSLNNKKESSFYKKLGNCFQSLLAILVSSSVNLQPQSAKVRCLFLIWIFFSLHLSVGYQSALMGVFTKTKHQKQIDTIQEIFENDLKLWLLPSSKPYFLDQDSDSLKVLQKWRDCTDIRICLHKTAYERDSVTCTPRLYRQFVASQYVSKKGEPLLHCFKKSIVTYPLQMLLWKGFPLKQYFNNLIGRIISSGLTSHWIKQILMQEIISAGMDLEDNTDQFKVTITHLYLLFAHLAVGYTLAFIALLVEMHVHKKQNRVRYSM